MDNWQTVISKEWERRQADRPAGGLALPLVEQNFDADEIVAMTEVLLSGQLTMAARVREFEKQFAAFTGSPYAVMVNSGSSANLLAVAVACNPLRKKHLKPGDEVLVPSVCWSTSVWPLVQLGLKPVFVDVDPRTLNVDVASLKTKTTPRTCGLMAVHILGNCAPMDDVMAHARSQDWIVIEDTCESLGSRYRGKTLGCIGDMGTYSFYFSHHMTTGEGGMVTCQTLEDYDLLKCLRAHGWTRELSNRAEVEARHPEVDPRFMFVNAGFNFRPMEIQAALGIKQLAKLPEMNRARIENRNALITALRAHPKWKDQFEFPEEPEGASAVWFGFPVLFKDASVDLRAYLAKLSAAGVENRPIVSGNFARQPGLALFDAATEWKALTGAERVHRSGFFVGLHSRLLTAEEISSVAGRLLSF